jgi:hypothetical protein
MLTGPKEEEEACVWGKVHDLERRRTTISKAREKYKCEETHMMWKTK